MAEESGATTVDVANLEVRNLGGMDSPTGKVIRSKQLRDPFTELYREGIVMEPPFDPDLWAELVLISTRYNQLLRVYARNTAGLGWKVVPTVEISRNSSEELKKQVATDIEILKKFYGYPHTAEQSRVWMEESFSELLFKMAVDREAIGNGYLEVSKNLQGKPAGVWHIPGSTVRLRADLEGFVQYSAGHSEFVYFKNFGDPRIMDSRSGEFVNKEKEEIPLKYHANEIIHFPLYSPISTHYGFPRGIASNLAMTGSRAAALRNYAFFDNDAVPRMAVLVSGGSIPEASLQRMEEYFAARGKGADLAHRVVVIHAQPGQGVVAAPTIKLEPLTVGSTDDASFTTYREANDKELREAFGLSELHLGTEGSANRAAAMTILRLVNQQEFFPAILELEYRLNATISKALGVQTSALQLVRPKATDPLDEAKVLQRALPAGAVAPRDFRKWIETTLGFDWPPMTEPWTEIPFTLLLTLIRGEQIQLGEAEQIQESMRDMVDEFDTSSDQGAVKEFIDDLNIGLEELKNAISLQSQHR